ncbi:hypothetical protein ACET3Z_018976 [Daucus carota]
MQTLPADFVDKFGQTLPFMVGLSCKTVLWCVYCDIERRELHGLNRFMKFYGVKIFNLVQFDYLGDGLFVVRLFKETAFESKYPTDKAEDIELSKEWEALNRSQYVLDTRTLEGEKAIASISFNACSHQTDYTYLMFVESDIDHSRGEMILSPMWDAYYKYWEDGSSVVFKFVEKSWTIKIRKSGEVCYLGEGLVDFASGAGLRDGDFLVAFREKEEINDCLRVCIYDHKDHGLDMVKADSFFLVILNLWIKLNSNEFIILQMVPFLVNQFYRWKLTQIKILYVGGLDWGFKYKPFPGYIYNLEDMIKHFRLKMKETIVFTFNESDVMYARVYQSNGVEINYRSRIKQGQADDADEWIWSFEEIPESGVGGDEDIGIDDPMAVEDDAVVNREFETCLTAGNVDKKTHGLFIPHTIKPASGIWKKTQKIKFITEKGVWDIGIINTAVRPRFSAGWNKFIRGNEYTAGQKLMFRMVEHDDYIDFLISKI